MTEFNTGQVASAKHDGHNVRVVFADPYDAALPWLIIACESKRAFIGEWVNIDRLTDIRPLVVLNPDNYRHLTVALDNLSRGLKSGHQVPEVIKRLVDDVSSQSHFKPVEPKGKYAEVEDSRGIVWFRDASGTWRRADDPVVSRHYSTINVVRVLSEGVK